MVLMNIKGKDIVKETNPSSSTLNPHIEAPNEERRIELFHVRIIAKNTNKYIHTI